MKSKKGAINSLGLPDVTSNVRCHVSNLAWETTEDSLTELCKTMGHNIVRCKVARMPNGKSKGWALMDFESTEQMEAGVKALHNTDLEGRYIVVRTERKAVAFRTQAEVKDGRLFVSKRKKRLKRRLIDSMVLTLVAEKLKYESIASNEAPHVLFFSACVFVCVCVCV